MNGKESFWTVRVAGGWGVKQQGSRELIAVYERQQEAWAEARRLAGGKAAFHAHDRRAPAIHRLAA